MRAVCILSEGTLIWSVPYLTWIQPYCFLIGWWVADRIEWGVASSHWDQRRLAIRSTVYTWICISEIQWMFNNTFSCLGNTRCGGWECKKVQMHVSHSPNEWDLRAPLYPPATSANVCYTAAAIGVSLDFKIQMLKYEHEFTRLCLHPDFGYFVNLTGQINY